MQRWFSLLLAVATSASLTWGCSSSTDQPDSGATADAAADAGSDAASDAPPTDGEPGDATTAVVSFPDTNDATHAFLTFDYLIAPSNVAAAAVHEDFVWGAGSDRVPYYRASTHPDIVLSSYMVFDEVTDGTVTVDDFKKQHPDWIVYQCDGTTPAYAYGTRVPLDVTNPAVVDWQVQTYAVPAAAAGYDAIAADEFELADFHGACGVYKNGTWTQLYSGKNPDPAYAAALVAWAKAFAQRLHALSPRPLALIPNYYSQFAADDPSVTAVIDAVDGIVDESGFTGLGQGPVNVAESEWNAKISLMEAVQARKKPVFVINKFDDYDGGVLTNEDVQWAMASYWMAKERSAFLYVSGAAPLKYGADTWRPEYAWAAGAPCGAMQKAQGVYTRLFQKGLSIVNPTATAASFSLPAGTWKDLYGATKTGSVSMPAHTGLVLLDTGAPHC